MEHAVVAVCDDQIIGRYLGILAASEALLESVSREAWDDLTVRMSDYVGKVEALAQCEQNTRLDTVSREQKRELLGHILENEEQLTQALQARMAELSELMGQARSQKRINQAYGSDTLN